MLSLEQYQQIIAPVPRGSKLAALYPYFGQMFVEFDISNVLRECAWIAQVAWESGSFQWTEELASGKAYERRTDLGNTPEDDGDGPFYKGRGLIQVTGRTNYSAYSAYAYGDPSYLLFFPYLLAQPLDAVRSSGWFWTSRNLNQAADDADFERITRLVNGGVKTLTQREALYRRALEASGMKT